MLEFPGLEKENMFEIVSHGVTMTVTRLDLPGYISFKVDFSSSRRPIIIARATDFNQDKFWTSIPEGRQSEAEGVGKLIEEYFQKKK